MKSKIIVCIFLCAIFLLALLSFFLVNKTKVSLNDKNINEANKVLIQDNSSKVLDNDIKQQVVTSKKANLFNEADDNALPISLIFELANHSNLIQDTIKEIADISNIYWFKINKNKIYLLVENVEDIRHGLELVELSLANANTHKSPINFDINSENTLYNIWIYDKERPVKHTKLKEDGLIEYVEKWNYDSKNETKYEKLDGQSNVISIKKEVTDEHSNLRIEHLFYDINGNIEKSISCAFTGANLVRFTYYDSQNITESFSSFSEYVDGRKVKETIYTSDYKVKSIYKSTYQGGVRTSISLFDNKNVKIGELLSE